MNLASNTAPVGSTIPSNVAAIHLCTGMTSSPLHVLYHVAGVCIDTSADSSLR